MMNTTMTKSSNQKLQVLGQNKSKNGREMHGVHAKIGYPFDQNNFSEERKSFHQRKKLKRWMLMAHHLSF